MRQKQQQGFGHMMLLLGLVVLAVVGFAGWYVWQNQTTTKSTSMTTVTAAAYKRTTTVPSSWVKYTDTKDGLSFYHPTDWKVKACVPSGADEIPGVCLDAGPASATSTQGVVIPGYSRSQAEEVNQTIFGSTGS